MFSYKEFRSYVKKIPGAQIAYDFLVNKDSSQNYYIPEICAVKCKPSSFSGPLRLNLLIPTLDEKRIFGGISTALRFFENLRITCGCDARLILTDIPYLEKASKVPTGYVEVKPESDSSEFLQIIPFTDREEKHLPISANDVFVATAWWTAYIIREVICWQSNEYKKIRPLLYFVQDYEPYFYSWSTRYLLAESTYRFDFPTYAIINSQFLKTYFINHGYQFDKSWCFEPILNSMLKRHLPKEGAIPKKRQILVYGRPHVERNSFSLILYSLKKWASNYADAGNWKLLSAGESFSDIQLGNGIVLKSLGKLTLEEYAEVLKESYIGISLMVSPHPSYPPLEMATFGLHTITNKYENKDLSVFNDNIISLGIPSPENISEILCQLCEQYEGIGEIKYNKEYVERECEFDKIPDEIATSLKTLE